MQLPIPRSYLLDLRAAEQAVRPRGQRDDDQRESGDLGVGGAEERRNQRFGQAVDETGDHYAPGVADATEDGHRECFDAEHSKGKI